MQRLLITGTHCGIKSVELANCVTAEREPATLRGGGERRGGFLDHNKLDLYEKLLFTSQVIIYLKYKIYRKNPYSERTQAELHSLTIGLYTHTHTRY